MLGHGTFNHVLLLHCPAPPRPAKIHAEMNLHHLQEAAAKPLCENSWQDNKNVLADRFKPIQQDVTIPWTPHIFLLRDTDPLHVHGNAANLEDRTIRFFYRSENFFCFVLQIGCIPTDVQGVYKRVFELQTLYLGSLNPSESFLFCVSFFSSTRLFPNTSEKSVL